MSPANDVVQMVRDAGPIEERTVVGGFVAPSRPAPAAFTDELWVILPEYSLDALIGPCEWGAIHGTSLPAAGAAVDVVFDDRNIPVVVWWEGVYTEGGVVTSREYTESHTLAAIDAGKMINCNSAGAFTLTIPNHATVALPLGAVIEVRQLGAGTVTVVGGAGVTIHSAATLETRTQYSLIALHQDVATDTWFVAGDTK